MILERFIVVEGLDGSGKSTLTNRTASLLRKRRKNVQLSKEPTDGYIGKLIRSILYHTSEIPQDALPLLYAADRYDHLFHKKRGVIGHLAGKDHWAISSRYIYSSFVYQGSMEEEAFVAQLNKNFPLPQFLFYIDLPPDLCLQRIHKRRRKDIFEQRSVLEKMYARYARVLSEAKKSGVIVHTIDGRSKKHEIAEMIVARLDSYL